MNKQQLKLIETAPVWKLDDHTKEIGRQGLTNARAILHSARFAADDVASNEEATHPQAA